MKSLKVLLTGAVLLNLIFFTIAAADTKPVKEAEEITQAQPIPPAEPTINNIPVSVQPVSPQAYQLNWLSINGGGAINASSASYQLGLSVGQSVAGFATSFSYQMGIGFWYGAGAPTCAYAKGDMNGIGGYTSADAVSMLNCVYLGTGNCDLCFADVNCNGTLTGADAVLELNKIYLGLNVPPWCGP